MLRPNKLHSRPRISFLASNPVWIRCSKVVCSTTPTHTVIVLDLTTNKSRSIVLTEQEWATTTFETVQCQCKEMETSSPQIMNQTQQEALSRTSLTLSRPSLYLETLADILISIPTITTSSPAFCSTRYLQSRTVKTSSPTSLVPFHNAVRTLRTVSVLTLLKLILVTVVKLRRTLVPTCSLQKFDSILINELASIQ